MFDLQFKNELMKFLKLKHGYILILLFILINIVSLFNNNVVRANTYSDEMEELLSFYYEKWGGKYNESYFSEISMYYAMTRTDDYSLEKDIVIPHNIREKNIDSGTVQRAVEKFYASYMLARNNENVDTVEDVRGYTIILRHFESIDFILILLTLVVTATIFSLDKGRGQKDIIKCTRNGYMRVAWGKIGAVALLIITLEMVKFTFLFTSTSRCFDLGNMNISLQSINNMHDIKENITVLYAVIFEGICEIAGVFFANLICAFIIVKGWGNAEGLIGGFASAYVPFFLFNRDMKYRSIPLPSAYLAPYNFLSDMNAYDLQYAITIILIVTVILLIIGGYTYGFKVRRRLL